ncbi:PTS sugar transporter subunit IIB [Gottschalkiaceae bacterium SANA]|nr:PTS sugar transporter subunit IIB [Gottschalkiaceae bacterium SANA]
MKVLIVCNGGMSSSILMKKMRIAAEEAEMDVVIEARPNSGLDEEIGKWDVCLLGPQIIYALENVKKILGIPTASVDTRVYALADGKKALEQAIALIK